MKHPIFITLTKPRTTSNPQEAISLLRKEFNLLRKSKLFKDVRGGAYQIEVKVKEFSYHIHIHAILDAPFIPYQRLFSTWRQITGVQCPQVDIRCADTLSSKIYVAKYTAKSAGYGSDSSTIITWYEATKGLRLWSTFGTFYNAKIEDLDPSVIEEPFVSCCPLCKEIKSVFRARDGPFVIHKSAHETVLPIIQGFGDFTRPIDTAIIAQDMLWTKQEVEEINKQLDIDYPKQQKGKTL
jgi:hypothetical protein